jgi:hypothetical protein
MKLRNKDTRKKTGRLDDQRDNFKNIELKDWKQREEEWRSIQQVLIENNNRTKWNWETKIKMTKGINKRENDRNDILKNDLWTGAWTRVYNLHASLWFSLLSGTTYKKTKGVQVLGHH